MPRQILAMTCGSRLPLCVLAVFLGSVSRGSAQPLQTADSRKALTLEAAVSYALANNPQLATIRQRRGIAAAELVIARTYPHNPVAQSTVRSAFGTPGAVTNSVPNSHTLTLEIEVRGQRQYRQQAAFAAVGRTEWEVAAQEVAFAIQTVRAFDTLLYRQAKLDLNEEFLKLNQKAADQVKQQVDRGTLRSADLILARAEALDVRSQLGQNRSALLAAKRDFYRALGTTDGAAEQQGTMDRPAPTVEVDTLIEAARNHRPDLFAHQAAVAEAEARLRLQVADRFGNPNVGPTYEYNETRTNFVGVQVGFPIPALNRKKGEIIQRRAEVQQAAFQVREIEVSIRQDVAAAAARVIEARNWVQDYQTKVLPELQKGLEDMERLLVQGQPGVDVLRVLDLRRKVLRARDGYLDALLTYTQALADLAQAVGDPALAMGLYERHEAGLRR